jgi:hypothetical protein
VPLSYIPAPARKRLYLGAGRKNLFSLYQSAQPQELAYGMGAYQRYLDTLTELATRFNMSTYRIAGVFAALSPNNSYRSNMLDTLALLDGWFSNKREQDISVHTYGPNRHKAWRICGGEHPSRVLPANSKTWNFFHNLVSPDDSRYATVDGHMLNAWSNCRVPMDKAQLSPRLYDIIKRDVQSVAGFCRVPAPAFQAVCWVAWRRQGGQVLEAGLQGELWEWEQLMLEGTRV